MEIQKQYYNSAKDQKDVNPRWWLVDGDEQFAHVFPLVKEIQTRQTYRTNSNILHARLYSNLDISGLMGGVYSRTVSDAYARSRLALNVVKSCTDTATSKIAKSKPRPVFLTEDGNWSMQRKAKDLTKFIDGSFHSMRLYEVAPKVFKDSCVFGTGFAKFYIDKEKKKVCVDRVLSEEIVVDDGEAIYGSPRQMHQIRLINKFQLIEQFPEYEDKINAAGPGRFSELNNYRMSDLVMVVESWHLPSSANAKDGVHGMYIENCTLYSDPYKKDYFPILPMRWNDKLTGFYGMGLAEELLAIQLEINKLLRTIQLANNLIGVPRIFIENNSMINTQQLNNEVGSIVKYTGSPPIFDVARSMSPEVYQHLENLYRKAYEITGISQLSANSQKPAGLNSGIALREFQDVESERFQITGQRYEQWFLDAAEITIDLTKDLASMIRGDLKVKVASGKYAEMINWSDVEMERDEYLMRCYPTSILPTTPAGKLQKVQELTQAGFIDKETSMNLIDFPDIDAVMSRKLAPTKIISKIVEKMLDSGEYIPPEPYMNLELALSFVQESYLQAKIDNTPEDRLDLLRTFMSDVQTLMGIGTEQDQMPTAPESLSDMPSEAPIAQPEQMPTSDLLQF